MFCGIEELGEGRTRGELFDSSGMDATHHGIDEGPDHFSTKFATYEGANGEVIYGAP